MLEMLREPFVLRALLAGFLLALACAPLGCLVLWRRMAYFGDALAHSSLLGIALGLLLGIGAPIGIVLGCFAFAGGLILLERHTRLTQDALLGVLAHTALAGGMVALSFLPHARVDMFAFLFGDVLAVSGPQVVMLATVAAVTLIAAHFGREAVLRSVLHPDMAKAEGVRVAAVEIGGTLLLTLVVAVAVHLVGVLMVTAFLIIPAAAGRQLARGPEAMVLIAAIVGVVAALSGVVLSVAVDVPTGPAMVLAAAILCLICWIAGRKRA